MMRGWLFLVVLGVVRNIGDLWPYHEHVCVFSLGFPCGGCWSGLGVTLD